MAYSVAVHAPLNVPMQLTKPILLSIIVTLFASACGQKGPLYLPQSEQAPTPAQDGQTKEPQEKDDSQAHEEKA